MNQSELIKNELSFNEKMSIASAPIKDFFRRISGKSIKTKLAYYMNLELFFRFLSLTFDDFKGLSISNIDYKTLNNVNLEHIDKFKEYLIQYEYETKDSQGNIVPLTRKNGLEGVNAKLATIKSLYSNLYQITLSKKNTDDEKLNYNLSALIPLEKTHVKIKTRLSVEQLKEFMDVMKSGVGEYGKLSENQKSKGGKHLLDRDLCIIALIGETGIRISELCGINIDDIDFKENKIKITRKGGKEEFIYYNFAGKYLKKYYSMRKKIKTDESKAFFISYKKVRITPRCVQLMIDKYSQLFTNKTISPHTFRRSFATNLYEMSGDIYLVASLIGDTVAITTKHYASQSDERKRDAINGYMKGKDE